MSTSVIHMGGFCLVMPFVMGGQMSGRAYVHTPKKM